MNTMPILRGPGQVQTPHCSAPAGRPGFGDRIDCPIRARLLHCGIEPQWRLFTVSIEYAGSIRHIYREGMGWLDRVAFVDGPFLSEKRHGHPRSSLEPNLLSRAARGSYCLRQWRNW